MSIAEKLPGLTDQQLTSLRVNAERLEKTGTAKQKDEASRLLPLIAEEMSGRKPAPKPRPAGPARAPRRKAAEPAR